MLSVSDAARVSWRTSSRLVEQPTHRPTFSRILAEAISSKTDFPLFDNSSVTALLCEFRMSLARLLPHLSPWQW